MYIAVWDLECTHLKGFMATILCCSIKAVSPDQEHEPYTLRLDADEFVDSEDPTNDRKLCVAIRDHLEQYHMIVGWNSKAFDRHLLNAKLLKYGEREMKAQFHLDPMHYCQGIGSKRLVNVQQFLGLADKKTDIEWDDWKRAAAYDSKAMDTVVEHCEYDVRVTEQAYWRLLHRIPRIGP